MRAHPLMRGWRQCDIHLRAFLRPPRGRTLGLAALLLGIVVFRVVLLIQLSLGAAPGSATLQAGLAGLVCASAAAAALVGFWRATARFGPRPPAVGAGTLAAIADSAADSGTESLSFAQREQGIVYANWALRALPVAILLTLVCVSGLAAVLALVGLDVHRAALAWVLLAVVLAIGALAELRMLRNLGLVALAIGHP